MIPEISIFVGFIGIFWFWTNLRRTSKEKLSRKNDNGSSKITQEIRFDGRLYDVTEWVKRHPGGRIIEFYLNNGEDATEAIKQFHYRSTQKVLAIMKSFKSRPAEEEAKLPSQKYENLTEDFTKLFQQFRSEGLFEPSSSNTVIRLVEIFCLGVIGSHLIVNAGDILITTFGVFIFACFMVRASFIMHEAGHHGFTGTPWLDRAIQDFIQGVCIGGSGSWWRSQHNRHHAMPQRLNHDVDLNTLPAFAYNIAVLPDKSKSNFVILNQAKLFVPVVSFLGIMNWKIYLHPKYAWSKKNYHELVFLAIHYYVFAYNIGIWAYLFSTALFAAHLLTTFALSHSHLPVTDEPSHWVEYSLVHTMNMESSWLMDWWTGGLNFQIEHHLFPTMPNFRHAQICGRVKEMAEKHGLPYICTSYGEALRMMFRNLSNVSAELKKIKQL